MRRKMTGIAAFALSLMMVLTVNVSAADNNTGMVADAVAPEIQSVVATGTEVDLQWSACEGAENYVVERSVKKNKYTVIGETIETGLTDSDITAGKEYTYRVGAVAEGKTVYGKTLKVKPLKGSVPVITGINTTCNDGVITNKLTWKSSKGFSFIVLKKGSGEENYSELAKVARQGTTSSYSDVDCGRDACTYSVSGVKQSGKVTYITNYDAAGIKPLSGETNAKADISNERTIVTWDAVSGADGYYVYRKTNSGAYKKLATVKKSEDKRKYSYNDVFAKSMTKAEKKTYSISNTYINPSRNPYSYEVQAYAKDKSKISTGPYSRDGIFHLEAPAITSVKEKEGGVVISWGPVSNAEHYNIYSGVRDGSGHVQWTLVEKVSQDKSLPVTMNEKITPNSKKDTCFTVEAEATANGETVTSERDEGFDISQRGKSDSRILYLGDSITYGSPYFGTSQTLFSYPERVHQLTGTEYYNAAVSGMTCTSVTKSRKKIGTSRYRMVEAVDPHLVNGTDIAIPANHKNRPQATNKQRYDYTDFDTVVILIGTNDYADNAVVGNSDSTDKTEYCGALNAVLASIDKASSQRVEKGEEPINIVILDLLYGGKNPFSKKIPSRSEAKNKAGNTLINYQKGIDSVVERYNTEKHSAKLYQFDTKAVTKANCGYVTCDCLHMTRYTYGQIGNSLTRYLVDNSLID